MNDAALVLLTDALWTCVCLFGLYHGLGIMRHAGKAYAYSSTALGRANARRQFYLNRRKARLMFSGFSLFAALGVLVMVDDVKDLFSDRPLTIDPESLMYRGILVAGMTCVAFAMRTLWQIYETWGEAGAAEVGFIARVAADTNRRVREVQSGLLGAASEREGDRPKEQADRDKTDPHREATERRMDEMDGRMDESDRRQDGHEGRE